MKVPPQSGGLRLRLGHASAEARGLAATAIEVEIGQCEFRHGCSLCSRRVLRAYFAGRQHEAPDFDPAEHVARAAFESCPHWQGRRLALRVGFCMMSIICSEPPPEPRKSRTNVS
jgi:hypothetical protein